MKKSLLAQAVVKFLLGVILVGTLIFLPAGTLRFWNGWMLMGVLFVPMLIAGLVMLLKNPDLLKRRLDAKEKQKDQNLVIKLSGLMFLLGFVTAGLDYRFGWCRVPTAVSVVAAILFLLAYALYTEVLRENTYLSRTIEVSKGQTVIDTGLYGIVRHPMYSATVLLFLTIPLILGSLCGFAIFLAYPFLIAARIRGEERFLEAELDGYREYKTKVKYRLIPFIW